MGTAGEPFDYYGNLALTPDGTRLAVTKARGAGINLWLVDLAREGASTVYVWVGERHQSGLVVGWKPHYF